MTRARDYSSSGISGGANAASNVTLTILQPFLTTANVREVAGNLYFSNTRTFANIKLSSIDDLLDVNVKIAGNVYATVGQALVWDASNTWVPGTVSANANAIIASVSSSLTTANVREVAGNLYYTNARARTAFTASDPTIIVDWAAGTIRANIASITAASGTTDTVTEGFTNKYYSNARVREYLSQSNLSIIGDVKYNNGDAGLNQIGQTLVWSNVGTRNAWVPGSPTITSSDSANSAEIANVVRTIGNFTTANLAEAASNLYYTNARARTAFTPLDSTILINWTTGTIAANVTAISGAAQQSVNFATFSGTANVALVANRANIVTFANTAANATYADTARNAANATYADAARYAANAGFADVAYTALFAPAATTAAQVSTLSNFTTSNLAEGGNLYYTNQRVYANVSNMYLDTLYDVNTRVANAGEVLTYNGTLWVPGTTVGNASRATFADVANIANSVLTINNFTTTNLREGSNLYYTTTRLTNDIQAAINGKDIILNSLILRDDLTVQGNTFNTSTANNFFRGKQITLAYQAASAAAAEGSGIVVQGANAQMTYSQTNDGFVFNKDVTFAGNLIPSVSGRFTLGTPGKLWKDLYLGAQTIYIGNTSVSAGAGGGLSVQDQFGNAAAIQLANVGATQYVTVDRVYSNVFPLVEFNSYIGGNVLQFVSNTTGNLYFGIFKSGDIRKFAGMRVTEIREGLGNVRSDLYFYNDQEGVSNSTVRMGLIGTGNIAFTGNLISINNVKTIDEFGSFVGNAYYGARLIDWDRGGTGANSTQRARNNLFSDMTAGLVAKVFGSNTLSPVSILGGTGVSIADGSAQSGSPTISIGQNVATTASVTFRDLTLSGNLYVLGNISAVYSNTLVVNDPIIQVGYGNPADNFDLGFIGHYNDGSLERHAGIFRDHTDKTFKVFDNLTSDPGLNDIDTANVTFRYANIAAQTFVGNLTGYVSTLNNHTTAALAEGANNLYYTNARVIIAVTSNTLAGNIRVTDTLFSNTLVTNTAIFGSGIGGSITGANLISATYIQANSWLGLFTANIVESPTNLFFTNARVISALTTLTTANVIETAGNLYFTNARVLAVLSNATISGNLYITDTLFANSLVIRGINVTDIVTTGNITAGNVSAAAFTGNSLVVDTVIANVSVTTSNLIVTGSIFARANTRLTLGNTIVGSLVSNAVTLTTETSVTDSITQLNQVLGKLVPSRPPAMGPTNSIAIQTLSSYRITTVTQTDRTPSSRTVAAGNTIAVVRRASTYSTNTIANVGLGDGGTVTVFKNGVGAGQRGMSTSVDDGIYGDLAIFNNVDYATVTGQASGFWESFRANASGNVSGGWNEVYINHTTGGSTPTAYWYYDATTVAAPQFTNIRIGPTSNVYSNSSTVPHFTSSTNFMLQFDVNRLSGDMFPTSNNFITGASGGAFLTPTTLTYALASIAVPLAPNLYVSSGNTSATTNVAVTSGFGVSAASCSLTADNSYNTGSGTFTPVGNVLYKTGTGSSMEETNHTFSSTVGTGSGLAARIENPGSTDNPIFTANAFLFNPQTSTLNTYDATIVGAVLKHDQVNYSTGYMPVGPNLSTGRSAPQYYTFKFIRTSVSKFDIQFSGNIAGMWIALPGSVIDNTSTANGWLDMSVSAVTSGTPGANVSAGGNGTNGCALGGSVTLNTVVSSHRKTCTFGQASSTNSPTNEIYVRLKLTPGQTVTALTLQTPSN